MNIAVMQPYILPYLGYFQLMAAVDTFVIFDNVNFIKKGWIHRNRILIGGEPSRFTLSVRKVSQNRKINEHEWASNDEKLRLVNKLKQAYARAPHFEEVFPFVETLIMLPDENVAIYLGKQLTLLSDWLKLNVDFKYSSEFGAANGKKGQDLILSICNELSATHYLNLPGGKALYNAQDFSHQNIELQFLETHLPPYPQINAVEFNPGLSIVDCLFHCGLEGTREMILKYAKQKG